MNSVEENLILPSEQVRNYVNPHGCGPVEDITTILVTRYWVGEEFARPGRDYFERRRELFLKWCLPSVQAQTHTPDAWLILVSPWARKWMGMDVLDALMDLPYTYVVEVPDGRAFSSVQKEWVEHARIVGVLPDRRWVLSARVDNDDALARDYLDALVKWSIRARPPTPCTLNPTHGLQYEQESPSSWRCRTDMHGTNHFTATLHRRNDTFVGAFGPAHNEIYKQQHDWPHTEAGIHQLVTKFPMWTEVLHEDNAANHWRPGPAAIGSPEYMHERFGVTTL